AGVVAAGRLPGPHGVTVLAQAIVGHAQQRGHLRSGEELGIGGIFHAPFDMQVPARGELVDAVDQRGGVLRAGAEAGLPLDRVEQQRLQALVAIAVLGPGVLEGAELLQRRVLVAGVDQQQYLPDQGLGIHVGILVDLGAVVHGVGAVVVGIVCVVGMAVAGVAHRIILGGRVGARAGYAAARRRAGVTRAVRCRWHARRCRSAPATGNPGARPAGRTIVPA